MRWLDGQLSPLRAYGTTPVVILDADGFVHEESIRYFGRPSLVHDYIELRRAWEACGRRRVCSSRPVFIVRSADFSEPRSLPWDIAQSAEVVVVRLPVADECQGFAAELPEDLMDQLVEVSASGLAGTALVSEFLRQGLGVVLPASGLGDELESVVRLVCAHAIPARMWSDIRPLVRGRLALPLCQPAPDFSPLQIAWSEWLTLGDAAADAATLRGAGAGLVALFASGELRPSPMSAEGLPVWSRLGASRPKASDRLLDLLDAGPTALSPRSYGDWIAAASWLGDVRSAAAAASPASPALLERVDQFWAALDELFQSWLGREYALMFSSSRALPITVDQVAPFLARRQSSNGLRQLLVIVDGMAFAQWSQIRGSLAASVAEATGCLAMCPTLTSVSRQALLAGAVPIAFADSLWTTNHEETLWRQFWSERGLTGADVGYWRTLGATAADVPAIGENAVAAVVVLAVDELMHGSEVLGDAQMSAGLGAWMRHGFLEALLRQADKQGFEVWITADHGNIVATPSGRVLEGQRVDVAGTRVRLYENRVLRDTARAEGMAWDPPGLPEGKAPLFAPGRIGYHAGGLRVSHGGLSVDEVIIPFARLVLQ
jgi:hypothetical protein